MSSENPATEQPFGRIELEGELVRLRSTLLEDRASLVAIRKTEEVKRRWRGADLEAEFVADLEDEEAVQLTIEADGAIVGLIQFFEETDPEYKHASIDIYLDPSVHRRGFGADALRTLIDYLLVERGHHRVTIDPAADNEPAIGCYRSVGFRPVGIMREYEQQADGSWADGLLMDLLARDWRT